MKQSQRLEHGLALSARQRMSLDILQAGALELEDIVRKEMEANPLLEEAPRKLVPMPAAENAGESGIVPESKPEDSEFPDAELPEDFQGDGSKRYDDILPYQGEDSERANSKRDFFFNSIEQTESLIERLEKQARTDCDTPQVCMAFDFVIGFLDDRGFLPESVVASAVEKGFKRDDVLQAIELLRGMEPSGIGAFDMRQGMMLQLEKSGKKNAREYKILERCYDMLLKRRVSEIADSLGCTVADVEDAIAEIAKLSTSPARDFEEPAAGFINVDLEAVQTESGDWKALLTDENVPRLRINNEYRALISKGGVGKDAQSYIKDKTRDAKAIIEAIENRQGTLLKIANAICARQKDFFANGEGALKPMAMQDIADELGLHATTISRGVAEKYMRTPFGIFPLRKFFTSTVSELNGEGGVSNAAAKARVGEVIAEESPQKPLSDSRIAEILMERFGISLARRTVAKYREELGIPAKSLRKRF